MHCLSIVLVCLTNTFNLRTEGHQRLKRYLHPKCDICDKEFPSRIEWVEHRLTPEHLRKLNETLQDKNEGEGELLYKTCD